MTTPADKLGSAACMRAAAPATMAAAADVPLMTSSPPPRVVAGMPTPGAAMNVSAPKLEPLQSASVESVAETPTTSRSPAG